MDNKDFLALLIDDSDELRSIYQEVINEWHPEAPPTITLYAALGHRIAESFHLSNTLFNRRTFSLIEQAMKSDNQDLVEAVATGLIEALLTRAVQTEPLWEQIRPLLGPVSLHHADSWLSHDTSTNDVIHPTH
ncbi:DUF7674 family protein [Lysobacter enzymogenes]|uniref:DUF7674 family protein n=1 Tax=Lysobacter enzymogenes TaxID=69 RepID=UPI000F4B7C14|nr:hypothetical protein [Lysobacter enzymogenes]